MGTNSYEETEGSDIIVLTAGVPRTGDMSRDDLVTTNEGSSPPSRARPSSGLPDAVLIVVSNPLDAMCHVAKDFCGWTRERVFGMAGILDTARFRTFIAWETGASPEGRADDRPRRPRRPDGPDRLRDDRRRRAAAQARLGRAHRGDGRAHAQGRRRDRQAARHVRVVRAGRSRRADGRQRRARPEARAPCTAYLEGEYGIEGLYIGVPVKLGAGGIEEIVELELGDDERAELARSADAVREVVGVLAGTPR